MTPVVEVHPFRVGMRLRFRRVDHRDGMLVHGPAGWAEFSPFPDYGPEYASRWLAAAIESATTAPPAPRRETVAVNTTVPAVGPEVAFALVQASGCTTAKVKVAEPGQDLSDDVERVAAVRDALGPDGQVRIDANGGWDLETAVLAVKRLASVAAGLEYAEQPCRTVEELAALRRRVDVAIAADESIRTGDDPIRVARLDAADLVVVKVQPLGGISRVLEVVDRCGLPAVVSSAVETSVGLAAGVALAAALPRLPYACGLGTATLLASDVVHDPLVPVAGHLPVRTVAPAPDLLASARPSDEDAAALLARFDAAAQHLEGVAGDIARGRVEGGR